MFKISSSVFRASTALTFRLFSRFSFPKHDLLQMPALSPTMKQGKILKWLVKEGDKVSPGDAIAEIETDKATMAFQVQQKGFIARINAQSEFIPIGTPVAIVAKSAADAAQFASYKFGAASSAPEAATSQPTPAQQTPPPQQSSSSSPPPQQPSKSYPDHTYLQMPAVSPTMTQGKILKWKIQPGDKFVVGDALFSIETDKAVMDYEATEKGILAKVLVGSNEAYPIGKNVAVIVKNPSDISSFSDFVEGLPAAKITSPAKTQSVAPQTQNQTQNQNQAQKQRASGERIFASPLAKTIASQKGIDLSQLSGSGPGGRIIKQDVQGYVAPKPVETKKVEEKVQPTKVQEKKPVRKGFVVPDNPFEDIPLSTMRKTIANRLSESKQTIPHYYVSTSIEMGAVNALRNDLNKHQKQHGVKISVNDIIIKAMALALRDCPNVNVQWRDNSVRRFKHADISVAVAIQGGLITPIVYKADTLGLLDIARRTKDIAKRARQGKLDPNEYVGGTTTVSNLGMFGINSVTSIINPPQATILGIGKTEKKIVFAEGGPQPYRVAEMMDIIASCDHRAVDGALSATWLNHIKNYLENPTHMLL